MISDQARKYAELKSICGDATYVCKTRIAAARRLLKLMNRGGKNTVSTTRIAKRIAKKFLKDSTISPQDRASALRLWETAVGAPTIPDPQMLDDTTEGLMRERVPAEPPNPVPTPTLALTPPVAAKEIVKGSDGHWYYVDANRNNLGRAPDQGETDVQRTESRPDINAFSRDL